MFRKIRHHATSVDIIGIIYRLIGVMSKMGTRISLILLLFLCSIPFAFINMVPAFKGNMPDPLHITTSVIAVILLFLLGLLLGLKGESYFVRWYSLYWLFGLLFFGLGYATKSFIILLPFAFIYSFPLYGLRYFLNIPSDLFLVLFCILIAVAAGLLGYSIGRYCSKKTFSVTEH
ncbi:hypothetical protein [Paenibacillus sp. GCM10028914]|uniref:hypothetical protein n=1 Tax=Paenibacillus sp. GCM10028914 TaxID=3273416 RepID=UPI0036D3156F